ncbi:MAG: hypothetical protein NC548_54365, partial [Lachnospiraceae bacterium]|nr:hypothetical protein [Lachnospiraceae bacterium]
MKLFQKLKEIFTEDPVFDTPPSEADFSKESTKPEPIPEPILAPEPKETKAAPKENYIQNKNIAINLISTELSKYAYSNDRNLTVLKLWIISPQDPTQVSWADDSFKEDLANELSQQRIDAVKQIEVLTPSLPEFLKIREADPEIRELSPKRMYYKTEPKRRAVTPGYVKKAWLVCRQGNEHMVKEVIELNPEKRQRWNIGRCEQVSINNMNDMVIKE